MNLFPTARARYILLWLARESRGVRRYAALNATAGILSIACSLTFVWATKHIVDIATGRSDAGWAGAVAILAVTLLGQLMFGAISRRISVVCQTRFSNALRSRLFDRLMRSEWTGKERFHSSDAVGRLASDVATVSSTIASTLPGMAVTIVQLLAAFVFLLVLDSRMAVILVLIMPLALALSKLYMKRSHRLTREIRRAESVLQCRMQEDLQHRVLISSLLHTEASVGEFTTVQNRFYALVMKRNDISVFANTAVTAGFMAGYTLAFLWCAAGLHSGAVSFGMMTAFLQLVAQVQRPVVDLAGRVPVFVQTSVAIERIDDILDLPLEESGKPVMLDGPTGLRMNAVGFTYPDGSEAVLRDFSHDFRPGTLTAVAGPTGTGKTTLLMLMLGLLKPTHGDVTFYSGTQEASASPLTRSNIVYVPQGNSLLSGTIRSNLLLARPDASDSDMKEALEAAQASFVADLPMGMDTPCGERGTGLSEGQAQRIAIARGLLGRGGIIVLDEPSSALDAATEERMLAGLRSAARGRTVIIVSHSPGLLNACDNVLHLK